MPKPKRTRTQPEMHRPAGGLFLYPEVVVPVFVQNLASELDDIVEASREAKAELRVAEERLKLKNYGQDLEQYVVDPANLSREALHRITLFEALREKANAYHDACSAIARASEAVVNVLLAGLPDLAAVSMGKGDYGTIAGPLERVYFCRFTDAQTVVFNCWADLHDDNLRLASVDDHRLLLADCLQIGAISDLPVDDHSQSVA